MNLLSFNYRGLGNPFAVNSLRDLICTEAPSVVFLSKTKLSSIEFGKIRGRLGDFHSVALDCVVRDRGLDLMWRKDVVVELLSMYVHHIDVVVHEV